MENNRKNPRDSNTLEEGIQQLANFSFSSLRSAFSTGLRGIGAVNRVISNINPSSHHSHHAKNCGCGCCPPKNECPPHCLIQISRHAYAGERIIVPFVIKNKCQDSKVFQVGVRELKMDDGSIAPHQPVLDKSTVTLDAGESEMVLMTIDLLSFSTGHTYNTEIVIREKDINQNVCFSLIIDGYDDLPVAKPLDECKYLVHWQGWQSHFYCEQVPHSHQV
jgi:hypothetical protein